MKDLRQHPILPGDKHDMCPARLVARRVRVARIEVNLKGKRTALHSKFQAFRSLSTVQSSALSANDTLPGHEHGSHPLPLDSLHLDHLQR